MSLPTPPSGILDKDRPWYRGRISDAQWDRLKAKLTGGTDAGGTSYSKFIDCSAAEADKIISNLKKDPRGYPQMYMPGGGESYQIMIDFYQWLKDSYLDEPKEEDIPVEVEVVEVEQKQPDEPIKVIVEAPFESTPTQPLSAPKRIRLPRRSGIIRPRAEKKKSAAERMAEAFDERLDDLVDSIKNPPEPAQPKQRKRKEQLAKIKKVVKPKSQSSFKENRKPKPLENLSAFTGLKIKSAFGRAADARRMAVEQGIKPKNYIGSALLSEFGGDRIAKTKGYLSRNPTLVQDPTRSRQQRYLARVGLDGGGSLDKLDKAFNDLDKKFKEVIAIKGTTSDGEDVAALEKVTKELKEALQSSNKSQQKIINTKKEQAELAADVANTAEMQAKEDALEQGFDGSSFEDQIQNETQSKGGEKEDGGGFDFGDLLGKRWKKWLRRLKNPKKFGKTLLRYGRRFLWKPAKALAGKAAGVLSGAAATTAAIVGGVGLAASGIGEGFFQLTRKGGIGEQTRDLLKKKGEEMGGPMGALIGGVGNLAGFSNEATKVTGNILDVVGSPFRYAIEAVRYPFLNEEDRKKQADNLAKFDARIRENIRGGLNRIDFANVVPDEKGGFGNIYGNDEAQKEMMEKMSEGGTIPKFQGIAGARLTGDINQGVKAMVGEAGPEMVVRGNAGGLNPLQSLAPIISSMRELTKRAGTWADPIENMVNQITGPIAKELNLPVTPTNVDIGQGSMPEGGEAKETKKLKKGGLFGLLTGGLGSLMGAISDKISGGDMNINPNMGGGAGRTTAGEVYDYLLSKGLSENHAKGITANISRESGFKLGAHNPNDPGAGSFGLFQWNGGRAENMFKAVPDWQTNWKGQIDYALGEDHGPRYLRTTFSSPGEAAYDWMKYWERPAEYVQAKYTPAAYDAMIEKMNLTAGMSTQPTADAPQVEAPETTLPTPQHQGPTIPAPPQRPAAPATPAPAAPAPRTRTSDIIPLLFPPPAPAPVDVGAPAFFIPEQTQQEDPYALLRSLRLSGS